MSVTVKDNSEQILNELQRKQLAFVTAAAESVRSEAVVRTPVFTGNLRSSILTEAYVEDGKAIGEVGPTANYAFWVEYGTRKAKAQPYMQPGYDQAKRGFRQLEEMLKL